MCAVDILDAVVPVVRAQLRGAKAPSVRADETFDPVGNDRVEGAFSASFCPSRTAGVVCQAL
ncbi:hypothetical protein GCM10009642_34920 [Nocardiopsis metallicus]